MCDREKEREKERETGGEKHQHSDQDIARQRHFDLEILRIKRAKHEETGAELEREIHMSTFLATLWRDRYTHVGTDSTSG